MIGFWFILVFMLLVALGFVLLPLLKISKKVTPDVQASNADIYNQRLKSLKQQFKDDVYFVYGAHDSNIWAIREGRVDTIEPALEQIISSEYVINGVRMPFPATIKPMRYAP